MEELIIEPGRSVRHFWRDAWQYRDLFWFLVWRDLLVRYKQTAVGIAWAVVRPLLTLAVLTVVFGRLGKMPGQGAPYALVVLCGMLPWQFFASALMDSGNSLVSNAQMVSKVYFPRALVPASAVMTSLVDLLISGVLLGLLMVYFRYPPPAHVALLVVFVVLALGLALGCGLWVSAVMVQYRDARFVLPFVVQFGLYISPVGFVSAVVPESWRVVYSLNPIVGIIDGFRWCVLGRGHVLDPMTLAISAIGVAGVFAGGLCYFRRVERRFADVI